MRGLNTVGPVALRVTGVLGLLLLLWNPAVTRATRGGAPVVLLDASLSMGARPGLWNLALDTARALSRGGVILRFGRAVAAFDTAAPRDGATLLGPALAAAAARGGPITIVTDGAIDDLDALPADVLARSRVTVLGRDAVPDAFVSSVEGPHQVSPGDTLRLRVTYGRTGSPEGHRREPGAVRPDAVLSVRADGRILASRTVLLPDSGTVNADVTIDGSRLPAPGWSSLEVGIQWAGDSDRRDDSRAIPINVTSEPAAVVIGAPPDWDAKFLARTLSDVARVPVKYYTQIAAGRWNEGVTLASVPAEQVRRALAGAHLVVQMGDPTRWTSPSVPALLNWNTEGTAGDWYLTPAAGSPVTGALATVAWDSLPPVLAALPALPESGAVPVLEARVSRRGAARPVVTVLETPRGRRATVNLTGLYRWDFRGGPSQQAYRAFVAGLVDWLLAGGAGAADWAHPDSLSVANGLPVAWRWTGPGAPRNLPVTFAGPGGSRVDTLRFGADGRAEMSLPPGDYRYTLADGHGRGLVVVDEYSAEWHSVPTLAAQMGRHGADRVVLDWRERWWLFALAVAAFAGEWVWRRRLGLP